MPTYCQHALHRDPALFPDPLTFDPDRWLDDAQADAIVPGAFLPFGGHEFADAQGVSPTPESPVTALRGSHR
ncbi:cytochrome P450 [Streptomyces sp. NPDC048301]|uniref:cytochrome P450 n=1 Tax=Streptomyces sp. NPDC048301 TaxID=3155631 RepID=UPI00344545A8